MNDKELYTATEYAEIKGITVRAVYLRMKRGGLNNYLVIQDGKKMLTRQLLVDEGLMERVHEQVHEQLNIPDTEQEHEYPEDVLREILKELRKLNTRLDWMEQALAGATPEGLQEPKEPNDSKDKPIPGDGDQEGEQLPEHKKNAFQRWIEGTIKPLLHRSEH